MALIYFSVRGGSSGGPSVFVSKMSKALVKLGHKITYENNRASDVALCIINTGKILKKVDRKKTKVMLRIDGIYNALYNQKFNRKIRPDMTSLHNELKRDIPLLDHTFYQSVWSRDRIWDEIVKVKDKHSIIHNGCDTNLFRPLPRADKDINLIHVGRMRDAYLMEMLIGTYRKVRAKHPKIGLVLAGPMDAGCSMVFNKYSKIGGIKRVGEIPNSKLSKIYSQGDIFLDVRQGCASNNVISEAQACGLPCVCSKWGGDQEMIVDRETGIIVDGGKWDYDEKYTDGLSEAVMEIMGDLPKYKTKSREHAINNLDLNVMVKKYIKGMGL